MYAILDIETTGGQFNEEGITEIAIYKFDGHEVVDQFISLINPEIPIQPFVVKLTGINNVMLRSAPKFFEVAKRIIEITQDCVIVAHNAQFDYRILRTEFNRLGYNFDRKSLCTVELSQKLLPEQKSYSLGKLVRALGIPMSDRHRATGDALATIQLFKLLLAKDLEKEIVKNLIKTEVKKGLSPKLLNLIESVPAATGIYYIHKQNGNIIYIGKSKNMKKRITQLFTSTSGRCKKIQKDVFTVAYELTGNELIALLKENQEIRINKPIYNPPQKKNLFPWALYSEENKQGYLCLTVQKTDTKKKEILAFANFQEAKNFLFNISEKYNLCKQPQGLLTDSDNFTKYKMSLGSSHCTANEPAEEYNKRVKDFIEQNISTKHNLIIVDKGRKIDERSAILIENGVYKGYAFYNLNYQINTISILKNIIVPMEEYRDAVYTIHSYIRKKKVLKTINF